VTARRVAAVIRAAGVVILGLGLLYAVLYQMGAPV